MSGSLDLISATIRNELYLIRSDLIHLLNLFEVNTVST